MEIEVAVFRAICRRALECGLWPADDVECIVEEVLFAEAAGKVTHGLFALLRMLRGSVPSTLPWKVLSEGYSHGLFDGNGRSGSAVALAATEMALNKTRTSPFAVIGMKNVIRYFTPGYYAYRLARGGCIGIVANNSTPEVVGAGGNTPLIGTNPLAIAFPAKPFPFLLDMATSQRAMGIVRLAKTAGERLPSGLAVDAEGSPTEDPRLVAGLLSFGGYKGFGLGLAVEMLTAAITKVDPSATITSERDWSYVFISINVEGFGQQYPLEEQMEKLFQRLKNAGCDGTCGVRIPGERSLSSYERAVASGRLTVDQSLWVELEAFSTADKEHVTSNGGINGKRCWARAA